MPWCAGICLQARMMPYLQTYGSTNPSTWMKYLWRPTCKMTLLNILSHVATWQGQWNLQASIVLSSETHGYGQPMVYSVLYRLHAKRTRRTEKVVLRQLHASTKHPFKPAMKYISLHMLTEFRKPPHLIRNSTHLCKQLSQLSLPETVWFAKLDVADFFMPGEHPKLVSSTGDIAPARAVREFMELNKLMLETQYVVNKHTNQNARVKTGSGMGLGCSGEVPE